MFIKLRAYFFFFLQDFRITARDHFQTDGAGLHAQSQIKLSNVVEISGARIGTEEAFYLYASGPDLTSIMPCKYGKPSGTFSKFVTEEALRCEHVRELLMKNKDVDTTTLVVSYENGYFSHHCMQNAHGIF